MELWIKKLYWLTCVECFDFSGQEHICVIGDSQSLFVWFILLDFGEWGPGHPLALQELNLNCLSDLHL